MDFNKHFDLKDKHAFLSPSNYHWLNYDSEKLSKYFVAQRAKERGTELHKFACDCIRLGQNLPRSQKTLNMYVNDAIGFRMTPEQILYYSPNCFGTADAICYRNKFLRVHDLKTGDGRVDMRQLEIYAALFFLEYHIQPRDNDTELRIYQKNDIVIGNPPADYIEEIMKTIITADKVIAKLRMEV